LGDLDIDRTIILRWVLKNYVVTVWTGFIWLRGPHEYGNEPSSSIKDGEWESLDQPSDCHLLK